MLDFSTVMVSVFTQAQRLCHRAPCASFVLNVSGLLWRRRAEGAPVEMRPGPYITLRYPGQLIDCEYGRDRENWVIQVKTPDIRRGAAVGSVAIRSNGQWCELPGFHSIVDNSVPAWRMEFQRIRDVFVDPSPLAQLRVRAGVINILRRVIDESIETTGYTPAARLKQLLDEDRYDQKLAELSAFVGYSQDHLRRAFQGQFGVSPVQYRNQRRAAQASMFLANGEFRVKEIAAKLGFHDTAQFTHFYRKHFGHPPSVALRQYRSLRSNS